jgi:predicted glutamine amidotransferase
MCRWLAYSGEPIYMDELIFRTERSLIHQSLHARLGNETTNGDGFGLGWFGSRETPGLFHGVRPAWNDTNLNDLTSQVASRLFFAHVRAATGSPVQKTNCHPFRFETWLFMHNGHIGDYLRLKRDMVLAVDPELFPEIKGTTDSEIMFYLALTFGLRDDPVVGMERMVGFVEELASDRGTEDPVQMSAAVSNGARIWGFRYASSGTPRTLFASKSVHALRELGASIPEGMETARTIVSEPLTELSSYWDEVPPSTAVVLESGEIQTMPFTPLPAH